MPALMAYDPATPNGRVRLLIDDTGGTPVFQDSEINAFLTMNGSSERRAAAQALLMIASSEARLSKKITSQDLQTDGPAVAAELRAQAALLMSQAREQESEAGEGGFFEVVEAPYAPGYGAELAETAW